MSEVQADTSSKGAVSEGTWDLGSSKHNKRLGEAWKLVRESEV